MTTIATLSRPVTDAEIRDSIEGRLESAAEEVFDTQSDLADALGRIATVTADHLIDSAYMTEMMGSSWDGVPDAGDGLWKDLRPTEAARLAELVHEAAERVQARCAAIVIEEMTVAGVQFAAEYPDAPRS